jgi:hypothetical protein
MTKRFIRAHTRNNFLTTARRIPPELFKETIAPLLLVEHTALIGITTPMDTSCDYSMMMDLKHANGDPMFNSLVITLMCDKCRIGKDPRRVLNCVM